MGHDHNCENDINEDELKEQDIFIAVRKELHLCSALFAKFGESIFDLHDEKGFGVLHWAAFGGNINIISMVISKGKTINEEDLLVMDENNEMNCLYNVDIISENDSLLHPIHWAAERGHIHVIELFLKLGIDINIADSRNFTPLFVAVQRRCNLVVLYLVSKGANIFHVDYEGDQVLHWAAYRGNIQLVQFFIAQKMDCSLKDSVLHTPLHLACIGGDIDVVKTILAHNPNFLEKDKNGKNCIDLASKKGHKTIVDFLIEIQNETAINLSENLNEEDENVPLMNTFNIDKKKLQPTSPNKKWDINFVIMNGFYLINIIGSLVIYYFICKQMGIISFSSFFLVLTMVFAQIYNFKIRVSNPGYSPLNTSDYESALSELKLNENSINLQRQYKRLCHICKINSKEAICHCPICNRCVIDFDYHDPFFSKCLSKKTRAKVTIFNFSMAFYYFIILTNFLSTSIIYNHVAEIFCKIYIAIIFISYILNLITTLYLVSVNLTSREYSNWFKFDHLVIDGKFSNTNKKFSSFTYLKIFCLRNILIELRSIFF